MAESHKRRIPAQVIDILGKTVNGNIRQPNLAELAQHFFDLAGGERQVAKMLLDEYNRDNCTPNVRSKIIQFMLGHLKWLNERAGTADELGILSLEDLTRELNSHIRVVAQDQVKKAKEQLKRDDERRQQQTA